MCDICPKSANNTQNQQARRKKTMKCAMAIPGFLKAFADSHTFLYSKISKTLASFLFFVLCSASLLFLSLFFSFFLASPLISLFSFHSLTCLKNPSHVSPPSILQTCSRHSPLMQASTCSLLPPWQVTSLPHVHAALNT